MLGWWRTLCRFVIGIAAVVAVTWYVRPRPLTPAERARLEQVEERAREQAMGKAAPPEVRAGLLPIDAADEAQHPGWPAIDEAAPAAEGCASVRAGYNRTRCAAPNCGRCWNGGKF